MTSRPVKSISPSKPPVTTLHPDWRRLATVIVDRALLEQSALTLSPAAAAKLRASSAAVELEKREAALWRDLCLSITDELLGAPVSKSGANSRRHQLMPITQRRVRRLLTNFSSELLAAARRGFAE
jgi:hypothetical protein